MLFSLPLLDMLYSLPPQVLCCPLLSHHKSYVVFSPTTRYMLFSLPPQVFMLSSSLPPQVLCCFVSHTNTPPSPQWAMLAEHGLPQVAPPPWLCQPGTYPSPPHITTPPTTPQPPPPPFHSTLPPPPTTPRKVSTQYCVHPVCAFYSQQNYYQPILTCLKPVCC